MSVHVNGVEISDKAIAAEIQHHPAESLGMAEKDAATALVVRELLLQEAKRIGIEASPRLLDEGKRETDEESLIRGLLEQEVRVPEIDEDSCWRFYDNNPKRFTSPTLFEAAHIFFPADPDDGEARKAATSAAEAAIARLSHDPGAFDRLARELSSCSSAVDGGRLGQVTRGQTLPEFETFLEALEPGQICDVPVMTRFGAHVVRLDHRAKGGLLPFEAVRQRIAAYLTEHVRRRAWAQYISILVGRARIDGIDLPGAQSPLVQ